VLAPYRGLGAGTALLTRCLAHVARQLPEVEEAVLHVQTSNDEAIRFYQRFGFEVGDTIPGYYKRLNPPDAVLLRKRLQPGDGGAANGGTA
jgi:ribosomal protein S18 acetylase RimI-like enzyme